MTRKTIAILLVLLCSLSFVFAQGGSEEANLTEDGRQIVTYWYYHKGNEATYQENAIARFNESQDKYFVQGFSVPDKQKYLVAMASDESPDVIALTNAEVISYQTSGLLEDMSTMGEANGFDFSIYDAPALTANSVDGRMYAFPLTSVVIQMFYNIDLLNSIGETEPPTTMEELFEMAEKVTTVDESGNIVLKEKKTELPKTWLKCLYSIDDVEYIEEDSEINKCNINDQSYDGRLFDNCDHNLLPYGLGKPMLALCQLLVCRNAWWKQLGWKPDWNDRKSLKHCIHSDGFITSVITRHSTFPRILAFPTEDTAMEFCNTFKDLIKEAKELL